MTCPLSASVDEGGRQSRLTTAGLDGVTALPDHGADGARVHVLNEASEEGLASEVGV